MESGRPFGRVRSVVWPIRSNEYGKLIPMFCMFFLISFVYHLLRNMKIALIVTLKGSGANTIPFLKIGCVLPCAILATYIFAKLATKYNRDTVFYCMVGGFLAYFSLFTMVLLPNQQILELESLSKFLADYIFVADGFQGLISVIKYWNISLFYVIQELWSTVVISMLLWGFANEITEMNEAKRFYAVFAIGINSAGIVMGTFATWMASLSLPNISFYQENYQWVFYQLLIVMLLTAAVMAIFYYINHYVLKHDKNAHIHVKKRPKISISESIMFVKKSKYLAYLIAIVLAYNIVWNLTDVVWTHRAKLAYENSKHFYSYLNQVTFLTGVIATVFGVISGAVIRKFGWKLSALVTPVVWFIAGGLFYSSILLEGVMVSDIFANFISNPANLILLLGTMQISLGRGCKYTIFDATKEMSFIPLSNHEKRKSKAVADGIASRLGKSLGSIFYIIFLLIFGNISDTIPYVSIVIISLILIWAYSVIRINQLVPGLGEDYSEISSAESSHAANNSNKIVENPTG